MVFPNLLSDSGVVKVVFNEEGGRASVTLLPFFSSFFLLNLGFFLFVSKLILSLGGFENFPRAGPTHTAKFFPPAAQQKTNVVL